MLVVLLCGGSESELGGGQVSTALGNPEVHLMGEQYSSFFCFVVMFGVWCKTGGCMLSEIAQPHFRHSPETSSGGWRR